MSKKKDYYGEIEGKRLEREYNEGREKAREGLNELLERQESMRTLDFNPKDDKKLSGGKGALGIFSFGR